MSTTTITYTLGRFVWRELFTRDVAAAKRFYGELFGWTSEDRPMGPDWSYTLLSCGEKQIGGMVDIAHIPGDSEHIPPHWAVYVSVADVDKAAERAVAEGGKILNECSDIPNVGRFAVVQDPQGAIFNLFRSAIGDPEDAMPGIGEFCWESLSTTDPAKAADFYQKVVGWGTATMEGAPTILFTRDAGKTQLASIGEAPEGTPPNWTPFVAVESVVTTTEKCRELGGVVFVERTEIPDVGAFGVLQDPAGATIFVFEACEACAE